MTGKILGQSKPAAATPATLYTVPANKQAQLNLFVANQSTADTIRIAVVPSGISLAVQHYIVYDFSIPANGILNITGLVMNAGDFVVAYSTNAYCSFTASGLEI